MKQDHRQKKQLSVMDAIGVALTGQEFSPPSPPEITRLHLHGLLILFYVLIYISFEKRVRILSWPGVNMATTLWASLQLLSFQEEVGCRVGCGGY